MAGLDQAAALAVIGKNIEQYGHHKYVIAGGSLPRFVYTIGLSVSAGYELIMCGSSFYTDMEVVRIMDAAQARVMELPPLEIPTATFSVDKLGTFSVLVVDVSWCQALLLGALDYYKVGFINTLQIVPDKEHWTIDVPDLSRPFDAEDQPVWRWLNQDWLLPVPAKSSAVTNLDALLGQVLTEVARWEPDQWEMFAGAGPDVVSEDIRVVPLCVLVGNDDSLHKIVSTLGVGEAVWRDAEEKVWHPWTASES
ncbi:MAG: hypothetical protein IPL73_11130 [Candidatus Obscuribacter sp.]|nr:hypothetical protein [Candidatus Obscuribacter sp.]